MRILIKLNRFFAWVLLGTMLLYIISGYGMSKGIIDTALATKLHLSFLTYIMLVSFTFHSAFAVHLAFKRWGIWNTGGKIILFSFFTLFFLSFVYIDAIYQPEAQVPATLTSDSSVTNSISPPSTTEKIFTASELSKYNGRNGNPAYVAIDRDVYDLSLVFKNGIHYSYFAGKDLTGAFYSHHAKSALSKYPIIGKLQ